jgi:putative ATPase
LAEAVVHLATAPKTNAVYLGIDGAIADVRAGKAGPVPLHLRDGHYPGANRLGHGEGYRYAHDSPHAVAAQVYAPAGIAGVEYYRPTDRGYERQVSERMTKIRAILHSALAASADPAASPDAAASPESAASQDAAASAESAASQDAAG